MAQDDLLEFQAKHFPHDVPHPVPLYSFSPPDEDLVEEDEDFDDGLGYYEDGVKRTLTDEQIKIFRHSEIHALLRERQKQRERNGEENPKPSEPRDSDSSPAAPEPPVPSDPIERGNLMKRKTGYADSSTRKRTKTAANDVKNINVTYEDMQYDEEETHQRSAPRAGPSSYHPSFAGRRIISYDD